MRLRAIPLLLTGTLALAGCVSMSNGLSPGDSTIEGDRYLNRTYDLKLAFPKLAGWNFFRSPDEVAQCGAESAIFCAANASRLLSLLVTFEDGGIEMSNEDYQTLQETSLIESWGDKLHTISLEQQRANGNQMLVWTYVLDGDTLVQAHLKRGTQNFRVVMIVPERAYKRRQQEIQSIVKSIDIRPQGPAHASRR